MSRDNRKATTRSKLILETWKRLDSDSAGARELKQIQQALADRFGDVAVESPAAIARTLADGGAVLRHPEVLDYDTVWRERQLRESATIGELDFTTIEAAIATMDNLGKLWKAIVEQKNSGRLASLQTQLSATRQQLRLISRSRTASTERKVTAVETEKWLSVWLQNPAIFADWLELRMKTEEFQTIFGK